MSPSWERAPMLLFRSSVEKLQLNVDDAVWRSGFYHFSFLLFCHTADGFSLCECIIWPFDVQPIQIL